MLECLVDVLFHGLIFGNGECVNPSSGHWLTLQQFNGTVPWSVWWELGRPGWAEDVRKLVITLGDRN